MRQLEQAKTSFPNTHLTVGVTGDEETHRRKGLTVLSGAERAETIRHCRWVDEVIEDCPWIVSAEFLDKHKFDYVAHDDIPYGADEGDDIYKPIKEQGKFLVTQRTEGVSTTGIITKIVRDYEQYIARQLKRGTSRQELNVSWLKKNELDLKRHVTELRDSIKTNWTVTGQEVGRELKSFWAPSRPQSPAASVRAPSIRERRAGASDSSSASKNGANGTPASAVKHLGYLDIPRSPDGPLSPGSELAGRGSSDFAKGYAFGLVGGIRSWMTRSRRNVGSRAQSPGSSGEDDLGSPTNGEGSFDADATRGRKRVKITQDDDEQV